MEHCCFRSAQNFETARSVQKSNRAKPYKRAVELRDLPKHKLFSLGRTYYNFRYSGNVSNVRSCGYDCAQYYLI